MTYLIQNSRTREYFLNGTWTGDSLWAQEFPSSAKAMAECLRHQLRGVELVLQFGSEGGRKYRLQLALPEGLLWPEALDQGGNGWTNRCSAASLLSP